MEKFKREVGEKHGIDEEVKRLRLESGGLRVEETLEKVKRKER